MSETTASPDERSRPRTAGPAFLPPRIVTSACLEFEACRYNGQRIPFDFLGALSEHAELEPVCPEVEIGLGVPREPVRLVRGVDGPALVQPDTGRDLTSAMRDFSASFLSGRDPDGFILKGRSPTCGTAGVKVYDGARESSAHAHGPGLFAGAVRARLPHTATEEEGRLRNYRIREHFLTRVFASARLRQVERAGTMRALVDFHTGYKLVLMAYDQTAMRALGRVVANPGRRPVAEAAAAYREGFGHALREPPRYTAVVNVLEHAWGYVADELDVSERRYYRAQLERYRSGRVPLGAITSLLWSWALRFDRDYLLGQAFFRPYPEALMSVSDSGKGRVRR